MRWLRSGRSILSGIDQLGWHRGTIVASSALAVAAPTLAWFEVLPAVRGVLVPLTIVVVPGVTVATAILGRRRALWIGLTPAVSLASAILVSSLQMSLNVVNPAGGLSVAAAIHLLALPRAWEQAARDPARTPPRRRSLGPVDVAARTALVAAVPLWWWATRRVELDSAAAFGAVEVLPWQYWAALALVAGAAARALAPPGVDRPVAAVAAALLAIGVTTFASVADGVPVVPTTFVHLGIVDAIDSLGFVPQAIDARFSWPGFFLASAAVIDLVDADDLVPYLVWYPAVVTILVLPALYNLGRALGRSERAGWMTIFVFIGANWVQQDYFSPQSVAFLIYCNILAVLAVELVDSDLPPLPGRWWIRWTRLPLRTPGRPHGWGGRRVVAVEGLLVVLVAATVVGHQLTPLAIVFGTGVLSFFGATRHRTVWVASLTLMAGWFAFGAADWWTGHLGALLRDIGQVDEAVTQGTVSRVGGDEWYSRMQLARVAWSAGLGLLAGLGGILLLTGRRSGAALFALAFLVGPASLVAVQTYGGEVVLRVFLYSSPVIAALSALALSRAAVRFPRAAAPAIFVVVMALSIGVSATRNVNVAFERTPRPLLDAARAVLDEAPPGATISPLRAEGVLQQRRLREVDSPADIGCTRTPLECILAQDPDYVVLTRTRDLFDQLRSGALDGYTRDLADQLLVSGRYETMIDVPEVVVLRRVRDPIGGGER